MSGTQADHAWAAGFIDGEGWLGARKNQRDGTVTARLVVVQAAT